MKLGRIVQFFSSLMIFVSVSQSQYYNSVQHIIGGRPGGMGGAYVAIGDNSTALWYNPAGLAEIEEPSLNISANTYSYLTTKIDGRLVFGDEISGYESLDLNQTDFSIVGNSMIYGKSVNDNWKMAFGLFAPFQENLTSVLDGKASGPYYGVEYIDTGIKDTLQLRVSLKESSNTNAKYYVGSFGLAFKYWLLNLGASICIGQYSEIIKTGDFRYIYMYNFHNQILDTSAVIYYSENNISAFTLFSKAGGQLKLGRHILGGSIKTPDFIISGKKVLNKSNVYFTTEDKTELNFGSKLFPYSITGGYGYVIPEKFTGTVDVLPSLFTRSNDELALVVNFRLGMEYYFPKYIFRSGFFSDFSGEEEITASSAHSSRIDFYGGCLSLTIPKEFSVLEGKKTVVKKLLSTFGINYRLGIGKVQTSRFEIDFFHSRVYPTHPPKEQNIHNISLFISESVSF